MNIDQWIAHTLHTGGRVPTVPAPACEVGTPQTLVQSHVPSVPSVPSVPAEKYKAENERAELDALIAEGWEGPGIDVDHLLRAIDHFGKRPVKVVRLPPRTRKPDPEGEP